MLYRALRKGLNSRSKLIPVSKDIYDYVDDEASDWYSSIYLYNEDQYKWYQEKGSLAGIRDVVTDRLVWDFDSKDNLEVAKEEASKLISKLGKLGLQEKNILVCFSGKKGFSIEVSLKKLITPEQFRSMTQSLANEFISYDSVVSDPNRIFRLPMTRHQDTKLFKTPIPAKQLSQLSLDKVLEKAATIPEGFVLEAVDLPVPTTAPTPIKTKTTTLAMVDDLDFTKVPKGWTNCKWSLLQGNFSEGERNNALMAIVATCRALGYPKVTAYYMAKAASKAQSERTGGEEFPKELLWSTIIEQIYKETWTGGQYTCKDNKSPWLTGICKSLGTHACKHETAEHTTIQVGDVFGDFTRFAENIDNLTLKTGIQSLDAAVHMTVGMSVGLIAGPGVGKTSCSLAILNDNSKRNIHSCFFSMDMYSNLVFLKLCQKHTGFSQKKVFDIFRYEKKKAAEIKELLAEEYKNVHFCFKNGISPEDVELMLLETQDKIGAKIKLAVIDYNELLMTPYSDPTQSSAYTAQKVREIANTQEVCMFSLFQPTKHSGGPSDEVLTYASAKGSGAIAQAASILLGMSRPGYSPTNPSDDKFLTINVLKNRLGPLGSINLGWDGPTGNIRELSSEEEQELVTVKERRLLEKMADQSGGRL